MDFVLEDMMTAPREMKIPPEVEKPVYFTTEQARAYHLRDCLSIQNATELIELAKEDAEAQGKKPCRNCLAGN